MSVKGSGEGGGGGGGKKEGKQDMLYKKKDKGDKAERIGGGKGGLKKNKYGAMPGEGRSAKKQKQ